MNSYKIPALGLEIMEGDMDFGDRKRFHSELKPMGWRYPTKGEMQVIWDLGKLGVISLYTRERDHYQIQDGVWGSLFPERVSWKGITTKNVRLVRDI